MAIDYRLSDMPLDINSIYLTGRLERLPRGLYDLMLGKVPKGRPAPPSSGSSGSMRPTWPGSPGET